MNDSQEKLISFLREQGIEFCHFSHPKADTAEEKAKNDAANGVVGGRHCKNLFLKSRNGKKYYYLSMPFEKKFQTGPHSRAMGSGRLNFAPEEELLALLKTKSGSLSPLCLYFAPEEIDLEFFMDEELSGAETFCFHPSNELATVAIPAKEFFERFLPAIGREVKFVHLDG